jgi:hypothetical protein
MNCIVVVVDDLFAEGKKSGLEWSGSNGGRWGDCPLLSILQLSPRPPAEGSNKLPKWKQARCLERNGKKSLIPDRKTPCDYPASDTSSTTWRSLIPEGSITCFYSPTKDPDALIFHYSRLWARNSAATWLKRKGEEEVADEIPAGADTPVAFATTSLPPLTRVLWVDQILGKEQGSGISCIRISPANGDRFFRCLRGTC